MTKNNIKISLITILSLLILSGCSHHEEALKILPNEISQANECISKNKEFQITCYDLIAYKNSIALLRLGIVDYSKGNYQDALKKYSLAKLRGNFYANALIAELYTKGKAVNKNHKKAIELLKDAEDVDPIAAYKIAFFYLNNQETTKAIKLLTFAAKNNLKEAQFELGKIYEEGKYTKKDLEKSNNWYNHYKNNNNGFMSKIYGM